MTVLTIKRTILVTLPTDYPTLRRFNMHGTSFQRYWVEILLRFKATHVELGRAETQESTTYTT